MKKILIPIDGSNFSIKAIEKGKEIAQAFNSDIILFNVVNPLTPSLSVEESIQFLDVLRKQSENILVEAKEILEDMDNDTIRLVSEEGDIATVITEYAQSEDVDLIVMGSQGLNAGKIKGMFIGSITRKVIHSTDVPVLVIK